MKVAGGIRAVKVPPGAGAVVMATGIVSVALSNAGQPVLSDAWLALAAAAWVVLAAGVVSRLAGDRRALSADARSPAALTAIAATAVIGSRLSSAGLRLAAIACLIVAAMLWALLTVVLSRRGRLPRTGGSFMLTVAVQSLAALCAEVAKAEHASWLLYAGCAAWVVGVVLYLLVLARFDFRQLLTGAGDQWVAGGALAISTLAAGEIVIASRIGALHGFRPVLRDVALSVWVASLLWLPALVAGEVMSPRLGYDTRRWSTVFPVGMYAVASYEVARAAHLDGVPAGARVDTWIAVAVWAVVAVGMVRRGARAVST